MDDTDTENDIVETPKAMIQKIVSNDTKIETAGDGIVSKIFSIDEADILVIKIGEDYWYKGKDITTILEYTKTANAINHNVSKEYKKSYADMGSHGIGPLKIDPQTIFIDDSGLFQLVSRSKKPEAIKLWRQITKEILPTLFKTGTYTMPPKETDIEQLKKSFYDDNMLSDWNNRSCEYLAYIGKFDGRYLLKFGESTDFPRRELVEHRKTFNTFNVIKLWNTMAPKTVEANIKTNFASKNMIVTQKIKGRKDKILSMRECYLKRN